MTNLRYFGVVLFLTSFHFCFAQDKWDLKKCVEYALVNNISIRQQDVQARLLQLTYKQSKLSQYPSANFSNSTGLNTGRSIDRTTNQFTTQSIFYSGFSLQTSVELFNFNSKKNTIAANRYASDAAEASVEKLKDDIALNVAGAYLQVLLNKQQVQISQVQIGQTAAQWSQTLKLVEAGSVPELNAAELEAQLATDSANYISAQGAETQSLLYLKALLSLDAGASFDIEAPPVELIPLEPLSALQPEIVYQLALVNLPQQRVNSMKLKSATKNAEASKAALYPTVALGANLQTNYSTAKNQSLLLGSSIIGYNKIGVVENTRDSVIVPIRTTQYRFFSDPFGTQFFNNFGNGVGINISVPIFNGGIARTNWQKAKLNVKTYELQQEQDNLTLKQDIYKAYTDAVTSLQTFNAATKSVQASQKAFDFAAKRYEIGLLNPLDLITSQAGLYRAKLQRLLAQFDYVFKMKVLEFYKGQGLKL